MKRKITITLLFLSLLLMVSCGKSNNEPTPNVKKNDKPVVVATKSPATALEPTKAPEQMQQKVEVNTEQPNKTKKEVVKPTKKIVENNDYLKNELSHAYLVVQDDFKYQHNDSTKENYSQNMFDSVFYGPGIKWLKPSSQFWSAHFDKELNQGSISGNPAPYGGTSYLVLDPKYYQGLKDYIVSVDVNEYRSEFEGVNVGFFVGEPYVMGQIGQPTDCVPNELMTTVHKEKATLTMIRHKNEIKLFKNGKLIKTKQLETDKLGQYEKIGICDSYPIDFTNFKFYSYEREFNAIPVRVIEYKEGQYFKDSLIGDEHYYRDNSMSQGEFEKYQQLLNRYWLNITPSIIHGGFYGWKPPSMGLVSKPDSTSPWEARLQSKLFNINTSDFTLKIDFTNRTKPEKGQTLKSIGFKIGDNDKNGFFITNDPEEKDFVLVNMINPERYHTLSLKRNGNLVRMFYDNKEIFKKSVTSLDENADIRIATTQPYFLKDFELTIQ